MGEVLGGTDLRAHILALPTKADLEVFANRLEKALRQDIEALQADTAHIGGRVEDLEAQWEVVAPALQALHELCKAQDRRIDSLKSIRWMNLRTGVAGLTSASETCLKLPPQGM